MHETFLAEAEAETEAFWPETEAFVNLSEARPRPIEAFKPEAETEAEALGDRSDAETEANNTKMCIFKLFKTWKLFEMYNLTWNGIFVKLALNRYNIYIYLRLLCVQLTLTQQ